MLMWMQQRSRWLQLLLCVTRFYPQQQQDTPLVMLLDVYGAEPDFEATAAAASSAAAAGRQQQQQHQVASCVRVHSSLYKQRPGLRVLQVGGCRPGVLQGGTQQQLPGWVAGGGGGGGGWGEGSCRVGQQEQEEGRAQVPVRPAAAGQCLLLPLLMHASVHAASHAVLAKLAVSSGLPVLDTLDCLGLACDICISFPLSLRHVPHTPLPPLSLVPAPPSRPPGIPSAATTLRCWPPTTPGACMPPAPPQQRSRSCCCAPPTPRPPASWAYGCATAAVPPASPASPGGHLMRGVGPPTASCLWRGVARCTACVLWCPLGCGCLAPRCSSCWRGMTWALTRGAAGCRRPSRKQCLKQKRSGGAACLWRAPT